MSSDNKTVKQPVPKNGMSFCPILPPTLAKKRFENKSDADLRGLVAVTRLLETQFNSFDINTWFSVTKSQPFEPAELEAYWFGYVHEACRDGRLNKIEGCNDSAIYEVC